MLPTSTSGTYQPTLLSKLRTNMNLIIIDQLFLLERVEYGIGSLSKLSDILRDLSISKAFLITGHSLATKTDVIEQVKKEAKCSITVVFSSIKQHAPFEDITQAVEELKQTESDGIIAVGGGSPIDAAKLVIYFYKEQTGVLLKLISIPTTLSAAEFTIVAGYTSTYSSSTEANTDGRIERQGRSGDQLNIFLFTFR